MSKRPPMPKPLVGTVNVDADLSNIQVIGYNPVVDNTEWVASINVKSDGSFGGTGALDNKLRIPYSSGDIDLYVADESVSPKRVVSKSEPNMVYTPQKSGTEVGVVVSADTVFKTDTTTTDSISLQDALNKDGVDIDMSVIPSVALNRDSTVQIRVTEAEVVIDDSVISVPEEE